MAKRISIRYIQVKFNNFNIIKNKVNPYEAEFKILSARLSRKGNSSSNKTSKIKQNPLMKNTNTNTNISNNILRGNSKENSNNLGNLKNSTNNIKINYPVNNSSNISIKPNSTQKTKKYIDSYMNIVSRKEKENIKYNSESTEKVKENNEKFNFEGNNTLNIKEEIGKNKIKGIKINNFQNALQINNNTQFKNTNKLNFQSKSDRVIKSTARNNELFLLK